MRLGMLIAGVVLAGCGSSSAQCGAGTTEVNGQCVLRCGTGTFLDGGACVPIGSGIKEYDPCSAPSTDLSCKDGLSIFECRYTQWRVVQCRGPKGCSTPGGTVACDLNGAFENDFCPLIDEGKGVCSQFGHSVVECRSGVFAKTADCSSCAVTGGQVVCTP